MLRLSTYKYTLKSASQWAAAMWCDKRELIQPRMLKSECLTCLWKNCARFVLESLKQISLDDSFSSSFHSTTWLCFIFNSDFSVLLVFRSLMTGFLHKRCFVSVCWLRLFFFRFSCPLRNTCSLRFPMTTPNFLLSFKYPNTIHSHTHYCNHFWHLGAWELL